MLEGLKQCGGRLPLYRWLRPRHAPVVVVLMFHDLRADDDFANWLRVSVTGFERLLDACAAMGDFLSPAALLDPQQIPPDRLSFLVTFDDGYRNNAELAAPLLEKRRIPALFCVSTGPLISQQPFWTDVVITPIQALGLAELDLTDHGLGRFEFRKGDESGRWDDIQHLMEAIKALGNEDDPRVAGLLEWLQDRFGEVLAQHLPRFRPLVPAEIERMAAGGYCHFGSHGHDHRILTRLNDAALAHSLAHSRTVLADLTGQPIDQLAYPNGDHDARVRDAAALAGYRLAYSVRSDLVAGPMAAFDLPRISVGAFDSPDLLRYKINRQLLAWRRRGERPLQLVTKTGRT